MRATLNLAIDAGFKFELDDFAIAYKEFRGGHWFTGDSREMLYSRACREANRSACIAYEAWRKRKPFIFDDAFCYPRHGESPSGGRIYVGLEFLCSEGRVTCTSFADDGSYLVACSYSDSQKTKVAHIYRFTIEDLRFARKRFTEACQALSNFKGTWIEATELIGLPIEVSKALAAAMCDNKRLQASTKENPEVPA
jgi:hypothetical protein